MRHAYQFLRRYAIWKPKGVYTLEDYTLALYPARQRLEEARAELFVDRRLVRDLEEAVRFLDQSCRGHLWVPMTLDDLIQEWN